MALIGQRAPTAVTVEPPRRPADSEAGHAAAVGDAIRIAVRELEPWIAARIGVWPMDRNGRVAPTDPSYLVGVLLDRWRSEFRGELGPEAQTLVYDLRHTRNRWAHHVPFDELDAFRGIDTCRRLLVAIGSPRASELEAMARAVLASGVEASGSPTAPAPSGRNPDSVSPPTGPRMTNHRRMRSPAFGDEQWQHRFDPHVAPVNALVDKLIEQSVDRWMPYVPPYHGGIQSEILLLYQDPGKMTSLDHGGSGFVGCENDDPSAQLLAECLDAAGLTQHQVTPWNAYPWFAPAQGGVSTKMIYEGLEPLRKLLALMPKLDTIVTGGAVAHRAWRQFTSRYPETTGRLRHLETFHTSGRGITNGGQQTKSAGVAHVVDTLRNAAEPSQRL